MTSFSMVRIIDISHFSIVILNPVIRLELYLVKKSQNCEDPWKETGKFSDNLFMYFKR